jgi:protein-disulfide isomerase
MRWIAGVDVGGDEAQRVAHVQAGPGRVREHVEHERLRPVGHRLRVGQRAGRVGRLERAVGLPTLLPPKLDLGGQLGGVSMRIVMVTFESFGCGWCGHFHTLTMPELIENWVDTGKLRIESRMLPYEQRASPGALAGTAAGMQNKYWELAEVMYPYITGGAEPRFDGDPSAADMAAYHQRQSELSMLTEIQAAADEVGLDFDRFMADFRSTEAANRVEADTRMGSSIGFTSTPAMVINGVPQGGFASYERMNELLEQVRKSSEPAS